MENETLPKGNEVVGNIRPEKPGVKIVKDSTSVTVYEGLIKVILDGPYFTGLDGCLRVEIIIDNTAANITDIQINLAPQIFIPQDSLDDFIVSQAPGSHKALLCLILTPHKQREEQLTEKQTQIQAGFDAISTESAQTLTALSTSR